MTSAGAMLGIDRAICALQGRRGSVLILNLHRVSPARNDYWPPLHPDALDSLIRFLHPRCRFTTFASLHDDASADERRPLTILSFDDGYEDFLQHAVPILRTHGIRANLNIVPGCVESGEPPLNVRIYEGLDAADPSVVSRVAEARLGRAVDARSAAGREAIGAALSADVKQRTGADRVAALEDLTEALGEASDGELSMLSRTQVQAVAREHELGAHSFEHEDMSLADDGSLRQDIERCRDYFSRALERPLNIYAFPDGAHRGEQVAVLRGEGIEHVLLVENRPSLVGARAHTRLTIGGTRLSELKLQALAYGRRPGQ